MDDYCCEKFRDELEIETIVHCIDGSYCIGFDSWVTICFCPFCGKPLEKPKANDR